MMTCFLLDAFTISRLHFIFRTRFKRLYIKAIYFSLNIVKRINHQLKITLSTPLLSTQFIEKSVEDIHSLPPI